MLDLSADNLQRGLAALSAEQTAVLDLAYRRGFDDERLSVVAGDTGLSGAELRERALTALATQLEGGRGVDGPGGPGDLSLRLQELGEGEWDAASGLAPAPVDVDVEPDPDQAPDPIAPADSEPPPDPGAPDPAAEAVPDGPASKPPPERKLGRAAKSRTSSKAKNPATSGRAGTKAKVAKKPKATKASKAKGAAAAQGAETTKAKGRKAKTTAKAAATSSPTAGRAAEQTRGRTQTAADRGPPPARRWATPRERRRRVFGVLTGAVVAAVVGVGLLVALSRSVSDDAPAPEPTPAPQTPPPAAAPSGSVRMEALNDRATIRATARLSGSGETKTLRVRVTGTAAPSGSRFEVWLYDSLSRARSLGVAEVGTNRYRVGQDVLAGYESVDLSLEPEPLNTRHSGESVVRVATSRLAP
ncbi:MAG: hypothetical protein ACR2NA_02520 [Solirubrobacterales bacterium]